MLCFDALAFFLATREEEDYNPLNNKFINFLLQYRTIRVPMEVMMQSVPQTVLAAFMYRYLQVLVTPCNPLVSLITCNSHRCM